MTAEVRTMNGEAIGWGYYDKRGRLVLQAAKPTARTKDRNGDPVIPFPIFAQEHELIAAKRRRGY